MTPEHKEPFCDVVREEANKRFDKFETTLEKLGEAVHRVDTKVEVLVNRERPPCEEMREKVEKLQNTKSFLQGGWAIVIIIMSSLGFLSPLIFAGLKLWK